MFQNKFAEAKALYDVIIPQGKTSNGNKYDLQPEYWKNFNANFENSSESVFSQQAFCKRYCCCGSRNFL